MLLYLAYGSNLSTPRLEARVGRVICHGVAWVPGRAHRFSKLGRDGSGKGNLEEDPAQSAFGVLYWLTEAQWDALAPYEAGYDRRVLEVAVPSSRPLRVETFLAQRPVRDLVPTEDYRAHYRRGMEEHGLPLWYRRHVLDER
jgi:hypothetical protein